VMLSHRSRHVLHPHSTYRLCVPMINFSHTAQPIARSNSNFKTRKSSFKLERTLLFIFGI
jgi:hypothetical protein